MARKSYKQLLIEKYPYLKNYIEEQWKFYENEDESFVGIQTKENIAENIEIDICDCGLNNKDEAKRQGFKVED
ncbi:hypothetical protein [Aliarcobacter butzleri]|uniref:hypothetical protein n=1 Tax=Aliarcobacter butzleri TaxID=28197 RepID=UPI002B242C15|nr:hypothetical protein [Aliarcobacter butzleri]